MQAPYIPAKDADFALWLANFSALLTAAPTDYGLIAGDAVIVAAANTSFQAAFALASDPPTRTSGTIANKDAARASATATVRPYAVRISRNLGVTDEAKLDIGVNLYTTTRTPVPPPVTAPGLTLVGAIPGQHTLGYADTATPASKKKPAGVIALQLYRAIGVAPAVSPAAASLVDQYGKSPLTVATDPGDSGKVATYFGRWITRSGPGGTAQTGPWSVPLVVGVI